MPKDRSVFEALLESGELEPWQIGKVKAMQTHYSKLPYLTSFNQDDAVILQSLAGVDSGQHERAVRTGLQGLNMVLGCYRYAGIRFR